MDRSGHPGPTPKDYLTKVSQIAQCGAIALCLWWRTSIREELLVRRNGSMEMESDVSTTRVLGLMLHSKGRPTMRDFWLIFPYSILCSSVICGCHDSMDTVERRIECNAQMRRIHRALLAYVESHGDFPIESGVPSLAPLFETDLMGENALFEKCKYCTLNSGKQCEYLIAPEVDVSTMITTKSHASAVVQIVLYHSPDCLHQDGEAHFLLSNGAIATVVTDEEEYEKWLASRRGNKAWLENSLETLR